MKTVDNKWNTYPRPQLVREDWICLNGEWSFGKEGEVIEVPFCPESRLSGIGRAIEPGEVMIYEKRVTVPGEWLDRRSGRRLLLHIGAADQLSSVYVNGIEVNIHEGGYLPFDTDITDAVYGKAAESDNMRTETDWSEPEDSEIVIRIEVTDELDHAYPWGKQKRQRGGMWYTPVSGIWQTVWLESVPAEYIEALRIDTGLSWVEIRAFGIRKGTLSLLGEQYNLNEAVPAEDGRVSAWVHIDISEPKLWSPEAPYLYDFTITSGEDRVSSYFALRTLTIEDRSGYKRLCLNGEPYFFNGLLDQGYWQDGIYTPEEPDAYSKDILAMKSLGFNTLRKHLKVEPEQFYYDCDRLGMVVFQDMVNNSDYSFVRDSVLPMLGLTRRDDRRAHRNPHRRQIFLETMKNTVKHLYNHPSICYWTIFNEGWGQFDADEAYELLRMQDSTRFIDSTSGWFHRNKSDVDSHHVYFRPIDLNAGDRPLVLSEFGGYACSLPGHRFNSSKTYGYRKCADEAALLRAMGELYDSQILPLKEKGLCAAIYTQLSDVEDETNGILTYDREILKFRSYTGTGRVEIIGNHTDHQGGRVIAAPSPQKIRAYVAENHSNAIRVFSEGYEPFEVSITSRAGYMKGTSAAILTGILEGFVDLFGTFEGESSGIDIHIRSEIPAGSGLSSSAAFEILLCRIINDRYYSGRGDTLQLAKIAAFAENEYYGKPCGMMDQLAVSLGKLCMIDFGAKEPEIEILDTDFAKEGLETEIVITGSCHAARDEDYGTVAGDMLAVAKALGIERLGDINEEQFARSLPDLEGLVAEGVLTELQVNRARHFYQENERVLAAAIALKTGNAERFLQCINGSGLSSERLLRNILLPGEKENELSKCLCEYRAREDTAALRLIGGGFGGSVLVFRRSGGEDKEPHLI